MRRTALLSLAALALFACSNKSAAPEKTTYNPSESAHFKYYNHTCSQIAAEIVEFDKQEAELRKANNQIEQDRTTETEVKFLFFRFTTRGSKSVNSSNDDAIASLHNSRAVAFRAMEEKKCSMATDAAP
ncbi:MAG: hypothetical protein LBQ75_04475 [Zoogloeaceae bacterium]|nr:hypothetical protein [Zoogloeaceae bacterium]